MANMIEMRVEAARRGENPYVIAQMASGWLVIGDVQPLAGYSLLLADPVVESVNALGETARTRYWLDVSRIGDALLKVTGAWRINYETWCNQEPSLHTHITPRYLSEADADRRRPACTAYDWATSRPFDAAIDGAFMERMRAALMEVEPPTTYS
jgi:diadenosine tetraphosphate (Ap4A) HIT family hydrolase